MNAETRSKSKPLPIHWSDKAKADLSDIGDFIARDNTSSAQKWVEKLILAVEQATDMPYSGRMVPELQRTDIREMLRDNYRIVYLVNAEGLSVLSVFEGHRKFPDISV
ncbi:MAG: type II toxin-antitoxin system RelE/ParE family toxin [Deltaproteobacteria bacterium]|nr:type II toxin-antitoxin system RelE/ParE family toxin [Deltaproteobacteria bacterium]